ncbi:helix-turn-helix domain-containing protein [Paenibacillus sp. S-38]|uniref:helix-turn-helix domain-containing protein n=1 Tax=Paenibacillus sp. S-38 TaxID=3416710 RepID=UPI003CFACCF1
MLLHEKIRALRKSKGMSQTFIAERLDMTVSSYNMKENGKRPISTTELESISRVLEVPATVFYEENFHVK